MLSFDNFFPPEIVAFVSDREVDFFLDRSNLALTDAQKKFLMAHLSSRGAISDRGIFHLDNLYTVSQVHGHRVIVLDKNDQQPKEGMEEADAIVTNLKSLPIAVRTADCLPVFLYASKGKGIGIVHAGWRGTHKKIVQEAIKRMSWAYGVNPRDIKVALGPGIRNCCYQVNEEMSNFFPEEILSRGENCYLDLPLANIRQLKEMGVEENNIFDCGICTYCDINYFSFRREGDAAGRMISLMMMKS